MLSYLPFMTAGLLLGARSKQATRGRLAIIAKCKFGIHDISRTELRQKYEAPTLQHASRARTLSRSQNVRSKRTTSKSVLDPRSPEISLPKILLRYRRSGY